MIYICKAACMPCKACDAACSTCSKGVNECCSSVSNFFGPITQNPLGGYVIGTWCAMGIVIVCMAYTVSKVKCDEPKPVCYVDIALAVLHTCFAYYIQRRLVSALGDVPPSTMSHSEIAAKARHVMMYDIGFCLYFFIFGASFFYNCTVFDSFRNCESTGPAWIAAALMIFYGFGIFNYVICWFACQCCCGAFEPSKQQPVAGVVIMGAPASAGR
eukprot:CAMPEP_0203863388 /NCGR_PEP_ID=MMETSP0359-20131031/14133_1 /ASSEMBLY_ACC=CAM_ASM_000338 /TAXON_ID=268821 /ORGANISM="Scrippsiella Hangoei, Strain SHTV-5" /LENGTH=214 /DNA_ID=CAMNT_0050780917 /DNA_START=76 /DNA_END=720 /DNA_ORIENTATION=+